MDQAGELIDFSDLESHVKDSGKPFREGVLDYIRLLGEHRGYSVRENSSVIKYGLTLGKIDVAWVDVKTIFFCEFASIENILRDLWLALEFDPDRTILILSSRSKASPDAVERLIRDSKLAGGLIGKTSIVDVSEKEIRKL